MESERLADKKECEMKQSNDTALCDLIAHSLQLNPQKHLSKMLIAHGGRVGSSLNPALIQRMRTHGIFTNWQVCTEK